MRKIAQQSPQKRGPLCDDWWTLSKFSSELRDKHDVIIYKGSKANGSKKIFLVWSARYYMDIEYM